MTLIVRTVPRKCIASVAQGVRRLTEPEPTPVFCIPARIRAYPSARAKRRRLRLSRLINGTSLRLVCSDLLALVEDMLRVSRVAS